MTIVSKIDVELFRVPLPEVLSDAKHGDHTHFELITVRLTQEDGLQGTGYTYTGGWGGRAIHAMIEHDLSHAILGKDAENVEALNDSMQWHIHYVGRGGIASFAIAAIDIALWDLRGKREAKPLWQLAGGHGNRCKAYCGGIDLNFSIAKLKQNVSGYLDRGFNGVKIKVGRENVNEDIERVQAIRRHIGSDVAFMVDANYSMDTDHAIHAAQAFESANLLWFEEPVIPENILGYNSIAEKTSIPLASGENLHTEYDFRQTCEQVDLGFLQPDAGTGGGITVWLKAAEYAQANNITSACP